MNHWGNYSIGVGNSTAVNDTSFLGDDDDNDCILRNTTAPSTDMDMYHLLVYGVLLNAVGLLGLIGNGISIVILSRQNMRASINCCLLGLATFDTILLITSILMFGVPAIMEHMGMTQLQKNISSYVILVAYPVGLIAQTGSVYLTVTVTVERYVAVCHPLRARSLCTYGRARVYVIGVAIFSVLYNLPKFFEVTYKFCDQGRDSFITVIMTDLRQSESYIQIYITWMYLVVMYLLPFLSLLIFNIYIYRQVRAANNERARLSHRQEVELSLAVMLLCVVVVFFLCNIWAFIVNVLEMFGIILAPLTMFSNLLVTVNSSVNFIIYCIFGQKFRKLFFQIFCIGPFKPYFGTESGIQGANSVYGEGRSQTFNGRSTTQCMRLSSFSGSQVNQVQQQNMSRRGNISPNHKEYTNVPLIEYTMQPGNISPNHKEYTNAPLPTNGNSLRGCEESSLIISPATNLIDEKQQE